MSKEKRTLDRDKPFGTVYGAGKAAFEQFGIQFDAAGNELPGFEDVVIVEAPELPSGDVAYLQEQILQMGKALESQKRDKAELEARLDRAERDQEAEKDRADELQGQLDTANAEINRLNEALKEAAEPKPDGSTETGKSAAKKTGGKGNNQVDEQLEIQTGGKAK